MLPSRLLISQLQKAIAPHEWRYASGYFDATTGLYKFGTRYYSPTLGMWTQQDRGGRSIRQVNLGNRYVYADNALVENKTREIPQ